MATKVGVTNGFQTTLAAPLGPSDPTATVASAIAGASAADRYDCSIDAELIGFTNCGTTTWTIVERGADSTTAVMHVAGRPVTNALWKHSLDNIVAAYQAGVLVATGREIDFHSGIIVTLVGGKIQVSAASEAILTDDNGNVLTDDNGNVLYAA